MENNSNRRLLMAVGVVMILVVAVLVWYFFYAKPLTAPSLGTTNDPFPTQKTPPRFQFLNWGQNNESTSTTEVSDPLLVPLVKVWNDPASGQTFITQNILKEVLATTTIGTTTVEVKKTIRATSSVLIFVDRTTGYIYGYPLETGKPYQLSNTLLPGIYDAYFFNGGKNIIMRYVDQERNRIVGIIAEIPKVQDGDTPLPLGNIQYISSEVSSVATNLSKEKISYLVTTSNGSTVYTISPKGPVAVASSPFREWSLAYGGDSLYVTTKPSAYVSGVTLSVPSFQTEVADKTGLMSTPGSGGTILSSMWGSKGLATFLSNRGDITILDTPTLAPKCAWGRNSFLVCGIPRSLPRATEGLPDDWLQGRVSFSDDLYVVDNKNGNTLHLYSFTESEGTFDITNISLSQNNEYFSFNKKQDSSLWLLNTTLLKGE